MSAFNGPYGLHGRSCGGDDGYGSKDARGGEMNEPWGLYDVCRSEFPARTALMSRWKERVHRGKFILIVGSAGGGYVVDAYKDGTENMQEALQWMADLAGAMTGMEVEVPIYKE